MRYSRCVWVVFCALVAIWGCRAPSLDWNGTWKLNPTKGSYQSEILTISILPDGEFLFEENSSHALRCDGKYRPIENNRTLGCTKSGVSVFDITQKENGLKTRATHEELSTDGSIFTTTVTEFRPSGPVITSHSEFSRLSGSNGFAGKWQNTTYLQQHIDMTLRLDSQALHIDYPTSGQHIDAPLDGADTAVHGLHVQEGITLAVRPAGNREFLIKSKRNGKVITQGSLKLSGDGRIITDTWWSLDRPADKDTLVYEKK